MRTKTQQRVLDASAELFNHYGIEAVSVNLISEQLKISPGNFTYHYKKKSDLLAAHLAAFEEELQEGVRHMPVLSDARTFSEGWMELLGLTYRYRFLFVGANYILANDLVPAARYQRLVDTTKANFVRAVRRLVAEGYFAAVKAPYTVELLVDSIWWQWLGWLLSMQIVPPPPSTTERQRLAEAVLHILFLTHHYVDQDFFRDVQRELKRLGRTPEAPRKPRAAAAADED